MSFYHHQSFNNRRPLGVIPNHFFQFDTRKHIQEKLKPNVYTPLQGISDVAPEYQTMNSIAPDFNNQKITVQGSDSVLPEKTASNPHRTTDTHFKNKRNEEIILSVLAIMTIGGVLLYIKR